MKRGIVIPLFLLMVAVQVGFCAFIVLRSERILGSGQVFTLRVAGYDPQDPFRGRYLAFTLEDIDQGSVEDWYLPAFGKKDMPPNQAFFVLLGVGEGRDYASIQGISMDGAPKGEPWIRLQTDANGELETPLDRFYLPQDRADEVDEAFAHARERRLEVRVKDGRAIIQALLLDGKRIEATGR